MRKATTPGLWRQRGPVTVMTWLVAGVLALCVVAGSVATGAARSGASVPRGPAAGRSGASVTGAPAEPGQVVLRGPLDWGDPVIVSAHDSFYLYSTQPLPWVNVAVEAGRSGTSWGPVGDALPTLPAWAQSGETWSPEVHRFGSLWVLYFAAQIRGTAPAVHCIGDAVSYRPTGPFLPAAEPFVCQRSLGGSIDPRVYVSPSGTPYLVWKSDNNSDPVEYGPPVIWSQQLTGTGLGLLGAPTPIFTADRAWQDTLVEAPDLVTVDGRTWLFYSGGAGFWSSDYAIGVARCAGPLGPCADVTAGPLLASNTQGEGPGEPSVFGHDGRYWLVYNPSYSVRGSTARPVEIAPLYFGTGPPTIGTGRAP